MRRARCSPSLKRKRGPTETVEGKWSAFIADGSGRIVDHHEKGLVGRDLEDLFGVATFEASEEGNWVTTEALRIWVVGYDGLVFGSGWHDDESGWCFPWKENRGVSKGGIR